MIVIQKWLLSTYFDLWWKTFFCQNILLIRKLFQKWWGNILFIYNFWRPRGNCLWYDWVHSVRWNFISSQLVVYSSFLKLCLILISLWNINFFVWNIFDPYRRRICSVFENSYDFILIWLQYRSLLFLYKRRRDRLVLGEEGVARVLWYDHALILVWVKIWRNWLITLSCKFTRKNYFFWWLFCLDFFRSLRPSLEVFVWLLDRWGSIGRIFL